MGYWLMWWVGQTCIMKVPSFKKKTDKIAASFRKIEITGTSNPLFSLSPGHIQISGEVICKVPTLQGVQ